MDAILNGFATALTPENLWFALLGCVIGTLVGVLPGLGSAAGMAILIPLTFQLPPAGGIIMLAAIFYGSYYGGTITTVLMNVPGEASSAITALDGYAMARQGRAGVALSMAAIGSFIGGTVAVFGLMIAAPPLTALALRIGPAEFFALMIVGLALIAGLSGRSVLVTLIMGIFGLILAAIGTDPAQGAPRFTYGRPELLDGLGFVSVVMGLFGLSEILISVERPAMQVFEAQMRSLIPGMRDLKDSFWPIVRGTVLGFFLGLVPGTTQSLASVLSYSTEVKSAKQPDRFGKGALEGVVGPETANNAHANAAMIPLFTLGIPGSPSMALLLGAFMIHGLAPGPQLFQERPELAWTIIASMYIGNVILLILNLPLVGLWVSLLKIPYGLLFPLILVFMTLGSYSLNGSMFDVGVMILFGLIGYVLRKADLPLAPIALTMILGPLLERKLRLALSMSQGNLGVLVASPISVALLVIAGLIILSPLLRFIPRRRPAPGPSVDGKEVVHGAGT